MISVVFQLGVLSVALAGAPVASAGEAAVIAPGSVPPAASPPALVVERVTTIAPYPRGLAMVDGKLYVLCRGRVRGPGGGVSADVDDQAGTIYVVDPNVTEPADVLPIGDVVRRNGTVFARPTAPPFRPWDRASDPPESDTATDRPYCTLRYHAPTESFYLCAFSGIDKNQTADDPVAFSKNRSDAVLRYDVRTGEWSEIERHDPAAGGRYPHHDPRVNAPPHGRVNGPDNCLAGGQWLYVAAKDNDVLVRYDLSAIVDDPAAGPPPSEAVLGPHILVSRLGSMDYRGHSALAVHDGWLYIGYRTSSVIIRLRVDESFALVPYPDGQLIAELVAQFDPYDPVTRRSANITDMTFDEQGRLYVVSAEPARIYRFTPAADRVFDARDGAAEPWADLAMLTRAPGSRPRPADETTAPARLVKSENILYHDGWLYVTSGDGYAKHGSADGTVYRIKVED